MIDRAVIVAGLIVGAAVPAAAQSPAARLGEAQRRFAAGAYAQVLEITGPLLGDPTLGRADRAEAFRLQGLAMFLLGRPAEAEVALYQFLRLDPEAHLDPALVPPDAVTFMENVRARHEGELRALKPRPKKRRYRLLNLVPPFGQFQNGDSGKGYAIGAAELVFLATNISTYAVLARECAEDLTCSLDRSTASTLQRVNQISLGLLVGVYLYGMIDGFHIQTCLEQAERPPLVLVPRDDGGGSLVLSLGF